MSNYVSHPKQYRFLEKEKRSATSWTSRDQPWITSDDDFHNYLEKHKQDVGRSL